MVDALEGGHAAARITDCVTRSRMAGQCSGGWISFHKKSYFHTAGEIQDLEIIP
jgi:hypothetical protein